MRRKNSYLLVGVALAILLYIVFNRPVEGLETTVKIADERGAGKVPEGAKRVKYGAGDKWGYRDVTPGDLVFCSNATFGDPAPGEVKACYAIVTSPDPPPAETTGATMGPPCKPSKVTTGAWAHKGIPNSDIHNRYKFSKALGNSLTPEHCGGKCCEDNKCNAFTHDKKMQACWLYYEEMKDLEVRTFSKEEGVDGVTYGTVDRSGGLQDLTNALSGGATQTMESVYGVLGSGLSGVAVVGIVLAVLAIGIPIAVYAYKYLGGGALSSSSLPIVNPITRMKIPVAK
jgi:hypothetical protein